MYFAELGPFIGKANLALFVVLFLSKHFCSVTLIMNPPPRFSIMFRLLFPVKSSSLTCKIQAAFV